MSLGTNDPQISASDIITDIENKLNSPGISTTVYLPWVSYAYQKTYQALISISQEAKERFFGTSVVLTLNTTTPNEYSIKTNLPRFGGFIAVYVKYGATGDVYNRAQRLPSVGGWENWSNISTDYRSKIQPLYYILGDTIGFIPVPPEAGASAKVFYIQRPYQLSAGTDIIDIPYRFIWPINNYVQSKAIQVNNEDYNVSLTLENKFAAELESMQVMAASEFDENDGSNAVQYAPDSPLYSDPLRF